jgi:hypothetical protein
MASPWPRIVFIQDAIDYFDRFAKLRWLAEQSCIKSSRRFPDSELGQRTLEYGRDMAISVLSLIARSMPNPSSHRHHKAEDNQFSSSPLQQLQALLPVDRGHDIVARVSQR